MGRRIAAVLLLLALVSRPSTGAETSVHSPTSGEGSLPELLRDLPKREVRAAGFQGLVPGATKVADVLEKLGEPKKKTVNGASTTWLYEIGPFPRVELTFQELQLTSVHAQFGTPRPIEEIQKELALAKFAGVPVYGSADSITALVYPERGLSVDIAETNPNQGVSIHLSIPTAESFVMRARRDRSSQFEQQLADLHQAQVMDANNEEAVALELKIWDETGFSEQALERAQAVHQQHPDWQLVELALAQLQIRHRQLDAARATLKPVLAEADTNSIVACRARILTVEIDRLEQKRTVVGTDPRRLVDELVQVIKKAAQLTKDSAATLDQRCEGRQIILLAHLSAAQIISESQWRNRAETVSKWLSNAQSIAESHLQQDHVPPSALLVVWQSALECHAALGGELDPSPIIERMMRQADPWLVENSDPLFQHRARTLYASALLQAARALQLRGDPQHASLCAQRAMEVAAEVAQRQPAHRESELLLGQALFNIGAIYGVGRSDHEKALTWYDKAEPLLVAPIPAWCAAQRAAVGDQLVSIGLSNWEVGQRQRGIELTEKGLALLQAAAVDGEAQKPSLSVALTNLASMHSAVGNRDKAREFTELARKIGQ